MTERVLNKSFKKMYTKNQIKNWVRFGLKNDYVKKDDKKGIRDWIKLLDNNTINI